MGKESLKDLSLLFSLTIIISPFVYHYQPLGLDYHYQPLGLDYSFRPLGLVMALPLLLSLLLAFRGGSSLTLSPTPSSRNTTYYTTLHSDILCALPAYGVEVPGGRRIVMNSCLPSTRVGEAAPPTAPGTDPVAAISATPHVVMRCRVGRNKFTLDYARYQSRGACLSALASSSAKTNLTRSMWRHDYTCHWNQKARRGMGAYAKVYCGEPWPSKPQVTSYPTFFSSTCSPPSLLDPAPAPLSHWLDICTPKHASSFKVRMNTTKGPDPNHNPVEFHYMLSLNRGPSSGHGDWMQLLKRRFLKKDSTCSGRVVHSSVMKYPPINTSTVAAACLPDPLFDGQFYKNSAGNAPFIEGGRFRPTGMPTGQPTSSPTRRSLPTRRPTSGRPSPRPTGQPTSQPTRQPTGQPSRQPTGQPSVQPSRQPTGQPTGQPTIKPPLQVNSEGDRPPHN